MSFAGAMCHMCRNHVSCELNKFCLKKELGIIKMREYVLFRYTFTVKCEGIILWRNKGVLFNTHTHTETTSPHHLISTT